MHNRKELKEFKEEIISIENRIVEDYKLIKIKSDVYNKYTIDTIYGKYNFWFDEHSIFGKFENIQDYKHLIPNDTQKANGVLFYKRNTINRFSGKFNFHYSDIYDFEDEIYRIAAIFQDIA